VLAGLVVALLAGWFARRTGTGEDSQLAGLYLVALAAGVALVSAQRGVDLTHLLFGSVLAVDDTALLAMAGAATLTLPLLAVIWRPMVLESLDPGFASGAGGLWQGCFLTLVVLSVVSGFAALGTLMSVGLMMLPAIAARHWSGSLAGQVSLAVTLAFAASVLGLLVSFNVEIPAGPAIVLSAGGFWIVSLLAGPREGMLRGRPA
jgi:zinc/manganese transport system permease protein